MCHLTVNVAGLATGFSSIITVICDGTTYNLNSGDSLDLKVGKSATISFSDIIYDWHPYYVTPEPLQTMYDDINTCPENLLLFFHHASWDYKMKNGKTLWQNLCLRYDEGVKKAESFVKTWKKMKPYVGAEIYEEQLAKFERQAKDAWWWRDACLLYFQQFSKKQLPKGCPAPRHKLDDLMKFQLMMDNYTAADPAVLP